MYKLIVVMVMVMVIISFGTPGSVAMTGQGPIMSNNATFRSGRPVKGFPKRSSILLSSKV